MPPLLPLLHAPRDDVPLEYASEEQAISCVGLVTPKPGVFMESMAHLLVVATTTEVGRGGGGAAGGGQRMAAAVQEQQQQQQ
jgi:hypothetical protein